MTDHQAIREQAQSEAHYLAHEEMPLMGQDKYTREDAETTRGLSWSNISTIYPHDTANLSQLHSAIENLRDEGYVVEVTGQNRISLQVSISFEVMKRFDYGDSE